MSTAGSEGKRNDPPPVEMVSKDGITYRIRQLTEVSQILPRLEKDRVFAAYAICQLEPECFPHTTWYVAEGEDGEALVMHGTGSLRGSLNRFGSDLFCMGDPAALEAILTLHPGPRYKSRLWAQVEHGPVLNRHFHLVEVSPKLLLYRNVQNQPVLDNRVRRLTGDDHKEVNRLFRAGGGSLGLYRRELIDHGVWYGLFEGQRLVALASYESVSPTYGLALSGRFLTHPNYRGKRYGNLADAGRLREAARIYPLAVSTIEAGNVASARASSRAPTGAGIEAGQILESRAYRRDPVGLASLIRRVLAQRRAKRSA